MEKTSPTTAELRAWARGKGMDVGDRGRLSPEVLDAWHAAHGNKSHATVPAKVAAKKPVAKKPAAKKAAAKKPAEPSLVMATKPPVLVEKQASEVALVAALGAQVASLTKRVEQLESAARATPAPRRSLFRKS